VHQWASDPQTRSTGLVDFDKRRDRFDADAADRLFTAEARVPIVLEPPGPLSQPETAKSNLLPIYWQTPSIWSIPSPAEEWDDWFSKARDADQARTDLAMREKRLWSLTPFERAFLEAIGIEEDPEEAPLETYANSDDRDRLNLVAELVRRTLISMHHGQLKWSPVERVVYFKLYEDKPERTFKWSRGRGRTVVRPRASLRHEGLSGYRHEAAALAVRRLGGMHVVSVSPTYLFTHDGRKRSSFHADALKKMKQQDRAAAVSQRSECGSSSYGRRASSGPTRAHFGSGGFWKSRFRSARRRRHGWRPPRTWSTMTTIRSSWMMRPTNSSCSTTPRKRCDHRRLHR
jgi:hypothetical protein